MQGASVVAGAASGVARDDDSFFRLVLDAAPLGAVVASTRVPGRFLYVNPEFTRLTGYTLSEVPDTGRWLALAYPDPAYHAHVLANWERDVSPSSMGRDVSYRVRCADGSSKDMQLRAALLDTERMIVTMIDVTDRSRAERARAESEARYRTLVERLPAGVVVHCDGEIVFVNDSAVALVGGRSSEEILGRKLSDFVHPSYERVVDERVRAVYEKRGHLRPLEEIFLRLDGEPFPVEVHAVMTDYEGRPASLVVFSDITDRKREEQARQSLEEQVRHAQKLESLGILAGGVAHDFNNMLMAMLGNAEMALSELPPGAPVVPRIEAIQKSARRAADLARQMLAYSGKGRFVIGRVDLHELFEETAELLTASISRRAQLARDFAPQLPPVEGDPTQLRQVMMNLVTNASEALEDGRGTITVRTGLIELARQDLLGAFGADDLPGGAYVFFEVSDSGVGIDPKALPSIFDPFFTTKFTGRGLGLAAVLGIVRAHRGAIQVESRKGEGSCFRTVFPAAEPAAEPAQSSLLPLLEGAWAGGGEILLIDDDPEVLAVVSVMLQRAGFSVLKAGSGPEGLRLYRERGGGIRCVLLDLTMPDMDGRETLMALHALDREVTVILTSGFNEKESVERFGELRPQAFIQKPYTYDELCAVFQRVLPARPSR